MKAKIYDSIKTLVSVSTDFGDRTIPTGALGTIVECYEQPEGYAVDLAIPNHKLVGGYQYENIILTPDQFAVIQEIQAFEPSIQSN